MASPSAWGKLENTKTAEIALKGILNIRKQLKPGKRIIYVSSSAAMLQENAKVKNRNQYLYSLAKYKAEQLIKAQFDNYVILRPGEVYGVDDVNLVTAQNIVDFCKMPFGLAIKGGISVTSKHAVAGAIVSALTYCGNTPVQKTFALGGENLTISAFCKMARRLYGVCAFTVEVPHALAKLGMSLQRCLKIVVIDQEIVKYAPHFWYLDSSEAIEELKYVPPNAAETALQVIEWLKSQKYL